MSRLENFGFQGIIGRLALFGIIGAMMGTTYTNIDTLSERFPIFICIPVCCSITLGFTLPLFLKRIPLLIRVSSVFIMLISSTLAINTFAAKEIRNAEERLQEDEEYQRLKKEWTHYSGQIYMEQRTVLQQSDPQVKFSRGAEEARKSKEKLITKRDSIALLMKDRLDTLKECGSISHQAYIDTWYEMANMTGLNVSRKFITISSDLIFSFTCDTLIPIFAYILVNIFGENILIPIYEDYESIRQRIIKKIKRLKRKRKRKHENENESGESEIAKNESFGSNFHDVKRLGDLRRKQNSEQVKKKIKEAIRLGYVTNAQIAKFQGVNVTPQRVGQIRKMLGI